LPLTPVHKEPKIASGTIQPAPQPKQLNLQLPLIQGGLSLLAERFQLLVQTVEQG
jgi:hypothetical protein